MPIAAMNQRKPPPDVLRPRYAPTAKNAEVTATRPIVWAKSVRASSCAATDP